MKWNFSIWKWYFELGWLYCSPKQWKYFHFLSFRTSLNCTVLFSSLKFKQTKKRLQSRSFPTHLSLSFLMQYLALTKIKHKQLFKNWATCGLKVYENMIQWRQWMIRLKVFSLHSNVLYLTSTQITVSKRGLVWFGCSLMFQGYFNPKQKCSMTERPAAL